ncbi:hypothetical protein [Chamaesiphon sp.]|uniref:hypothetical protein n=1 Tax=Chamaesiphon sp. TaxID=2814140 RepID=UPI0035932E25
MVFSSLTAGGKASSSIPLITPKPSTIHHSPFTIHCLEKVLYLGKPQERTFRHPPSTIHH